MVTPLIGLTARRLRNGRVAGWTGSGVGERDGYLERIGAAGAFAVLMDPAPAPPGEIAELVARFDAIVLTGGPDIEPHRYNQTPHEAVYGSDDIVDDFEFEIARAAQMSNTPLLAICRGLQVLNVAFGGTMHQHIPDLPGIEPHGIPGEHNGARLHDVDIAVDSRLHTVLSSSVAKCSCHHHQAIDELAPGWRVAARAHDGIIEAIEPMHSDWFVVAVQWHPEDTAATDSVQQALFDSLVALALATVS